MNEIAWSGPLLSQNSLDKERQGNLGERADRKIDVDSDERPGVETAHPKIFVGGV
jgi:hypothetical protein